MAMFDLGRAGDSGVPADDDSDEANGVVVSPEGDGEEDRRDKE